MVRMTALLQLVLVAAPSRTGAADRPNILFFLADDLGWRDLGCYGSIFYESPTLDRLAQEGIRFTNAYTAGTACSPTRASIITGQTPARHGCTNYGGNINPDKHVGLANRRNHSAGTRGRTEHEQPKLLQSMRYWFPVPRRLGGKVFRCQ